MDKDENYMQELADGYRPDVERLVKYIPWLETKAGANISRIYAGEGIGKHSITFPVYDSAMMSLVQDAKRTKLLDRNYPYIYARNRIRTVAQEQEYKEQATIRQMDGLCGILSKYILGGMTKGTVWTEGVSNGSILKTLIKMKEILEFWQKR